MQSWGIQTLPLWADRADGGVAGPAQRGGPAVLPPGLSLGHTDPQQEQEIEAGGAELRISQNGNCVHLRVPKADGPQAQRGIRGAVRGLSPGAARRCKRMLLSVDHSKVSATFEGCNTVPAGEFGFDDFRVFLKNWRKRFERRWPGVAAAWVKELTIKGTPHLHFVVVFPLGVSVPSLRQFRQWNDAAWAEVVKSSHPSHKRTACRVNIVRSWARVCRYLSGYLVKSVDGMENDQARTGKMWGCVGRKFLPSSWRSIPLNRSEKQQVSRTLCRHRKAQKTILLSTDTHSLKKSFGRPVRCWKRLSSHVRYGEEFCVDAGEVPEPRGFRAGRIVGMLKEDEGYRLRRITPRPYRRELIKNVWVQDVETSKVERSPIAVAKLVTRVDPATGKRERVYVDEVNDVPSAWHYLPSSEVLRLVEYVRRDAAAGLTACERRWLQLDESPGERAIIPSRTFCGD